MARVDISALTAWVTEAAAAHPRELATALAQQFSLSRRSALKALRQLQALGWLANEGTARKPLHRPGALRQVVRRYTLAGLQEDLAWSADFAPHFKLPAAVQRMLQHAFCELLNNAVDHSGGQTVSVTLRQTANQVQLLVCDDGCGIFQKLQQAFDMATPAQAMLELSKGKLSTAPEAHTGRGLFFVSRLADVFDLQGNHSAFQRWGLDGGRWRAGRPVARPGTSVYLSILLDTPRTLEAVLRAHSADGQGFGLDRTAVPLNLMVSDDTALDARSQARRVAQRLGDFDSVQIDFAGLNFIGQGFADELFRVQARARPTLRLVPVNMDPQVAAMVEAVRR